MGIAVIGLAFVSLLSLSSSCQEKDLDQLWKAYKSRHVKSYLLHEETPRRIIWEQNVHRIGAHNLEADLGLHSYKLELNKFSDMLESELDNYRSCLKVGENAAVGKSKYYECDRRCLLSLPESIDWREKNLVTPVKDQGDCGSCWAFSSTGALEGQTKAKHGYLISLSEQNLVDCSWKEGNQGCNGGWMDYAFNYVIQNAGIDTESSYPYLGKEDVCKFNPSSVGANCSSFIKIKAGSEKLLQAAVANIGPISVAISISGYKFMHYKEGIYYEQHCSRTDLSHAVLVVGYGTRNGNDYWIVKNSWGTSWGMDGYILMARNKHNLCGIATHAVYPVV